MNSFRFYRCHPPELARIHAMTKRKGRRPYTFFLGCLAILLAAYTESLLAVASPTITLIPIGTYASGLFKQSAAEIVAHDPATQRLFVVNAHASRIDVLDIEDPTAPTQVDVIDMRPYGAVANYVAVHEGVIAVAVEAAVRTDPGMVVFFDSELQFLSAVQVGAVPDMLTFSPNGRWVLVANEGEPSGDYSIDPEGSVSIIDVSADAADVTQANVRTVGFAAFNQATLDPSIRIFGPRATVAQDLEPEFLTVSHDSQTAWVTLQENNALAIIDIKAGVATHLVGLGFKEHAGAGNGMDASDRDNAINITTWPVKGMYQPDAIASYTFRGETFLVLANEGDGREYPVFNEEVRVKELTLDPAAFPNAAVLQQDNMLGRLRVTKVNGDIDHDGDYDELYSFGARSFSIRTATGALVFDSGEQFEQVTAAVYPANFNAGNDNNRFDNRSPAKGPEPEGIEIGKAFGRTLAFIGLERIGGIVVYDISDPLAPSLVEYVNNRNFGATPGTLAAGDLAPEGLFFINEETSPTGTPLLAVANEVSGTTTIFEITQTP